MWQSSVLPGLIVGLGVALVIAQLVPRRPQLKSALARLTSAEPISARDSDSTTQTRVGAWAHTHLPDLPGFTIPTRDLRLVGIPVNEFLYQKVRLGVIGFVAPSVLAVLLVALGMIPPFIPFLVGIPIAILFWFGPDRDLKLSAGDAREEFSRAAAVYLELVAAERKRGATAAHALNSAATVGNSVVFVRIRKELTRAEYAGIQPWNALNDFAEEIGVPELGEVGKIMRLGGENGASVYETLRQRGRGLRVQLLNQEQTTANKISERMTLPLAALAMIFVLIILGAPMLNLVQ